MAYMSNDLISRSGYSGVGDFWDDLLSGAGKVVQVYGSTQQAQGAASQAQRDIQAAMAAQQGPSTGTILLIGGAAVAAILLLRKRS